MLIAGIVHNRCTTLCRHLSVHKLSSSACVM